MDGKKAQQLRMYTVYRDPGDHPGFFVVRAWTVTGPDAGQPDPSPLAIGPTLDSVRRHLPPGLERLARSPDDDPVIVETWI